MTRLAVAITLLCACSDIEGIGGGAGFDFFGLTGHVDVCKTSDAAPLELCTNVDDGELATSVGDVLGGAWACAPTPRHLGPCLYSCTPHRGCNALNGCWCPAEADPRMFPSDEIIYDVSRCDDNTEE